MIKSFDELNSKISVCSDNLDAKFSGTNGKRAIVLCGGTGCLSSNSAEIKSKFEELISNNNMEDDVTVNIAGCFGFCSQGPFVKIYPEDTLYRLVRLKTFKKFLKKILKTAKLLKDYCLLTPPQKRR